MSGPQWEDDRDDVARHPNFDIVSELLTKLLDKFSEPGFQVELQRLLLEAEKSGLGRAAGAERADLVQRVHEEVCADYSITDDAMMCKLIAPFVSEQTISSQLALMDELLALAPNASRDYVLHKSSPVESSAEKANDFWEDDGLRWLGKLDVARDPLWIEKEVNLDIVSELLTKLLDKFSEPGFQVVLQRLLLEAEKSGLGRGAVAGRAALVKRVHEEVCADFYITDEPMMCKLIAPFGSEQKISSQLASMDELLALAPNASKNYVLRKSSQVNSSAQKANDFWKCQAQRLYREKTNAAKSRSEQSD